MTKNRADLKNFTWHMSMKTVKCNDILLVDEEYLQIGEFFDPFPLDLIGCLRGETYTAPNVM
jgi:hypothetical protein